MGIAFFRFNLSSDRNWCVTQCPMVLVFTFTFKWNESVYLWFLGLLPYISCVSISHCFSETNKQTEKQRKTYKQYPNYCFFSGWIKQTEIFIFFVLLLSSCFFVVCLCGNVFIGSYSVYILKLWSIHRIHRDDGVRRMFASEYTMSVDTKRQKGNE